jgi:site-specific DNA recombinase
MKAMGYARISLDKSGQGAGVERQTADIRQVAQLRGLDLVDIVADNDVSAAGKRVRPGFERVLAALDGGAVSVVVAWALDRLTRNRRDTVRLIETCQRRGATIALVRGSDLDMSTPAGRLTADLLAAVARSEIETKSDRQIRANLQAVEKGQWRGGRRPFGYESDGRTVREAEAEAVRDAYRWILAGVSLAEIARRWNARGFTTPQGARGTGEPILWGQSNLSRTVRNPRYAGMRTHKGEITGKAEWLALVDDETWYAAQAALRAPGRRPNRGDKRLLTGVALCGVCGVPVWAGGGATGRGVYRCRATTAHFSRMRQPVDEYVSAVVVGRLSRPDVAGVFRHETKRGTDTGVLIRAADEARSKFDGLAEAYAEGVITMGQLRKGTERLRAIIESAESRIIVANVGLSEARQLVSADDVRAAWDALSRDAQRRVIDALMVVHLDPPGRGVRTLNPDTVRIEWRSA